MFPVLLFGWLWIACHTPSSPSVSLPAVPLAPSVDVPPEVPREPTGLQTLVVGDHKPVLIALHGRGDSPDGFVRLARMWADVATVVVPTAPIPYGNGFSWFPIAARQDDAALAQAVDAAAGQVAGLIHARRGADTPVVVTGFSQGGMLSFALAVRHPELVDAAVPMSGFLPRGLWPTALPAHAPVIAAVHGTADDVLPYALAEASVAHLSSLGWPATLTSFEGVRHSVPAPVRDAVDAAVRAGLTPRPTAGE